MRDFYLTVESTRCANCGTDTTHCKDEWHCPNPDCQTDFHTGERVRTVLP